MLTKADDYPIHQTPEPVAYSGTDRNFYDRYFFNGYSADGEIFFAAALGVYPHLNIMDASFSLVVDGKQHNLHASRILHMERMDIEVAPIFIDVIEPLKVLGVRVEDNDHGLTANLTFHRRAVAIEEPRFTHRNGPRVFMDYTRLTQNGTWEGWIELNGTRIDVARDAFQGTRDRSWGVRPVGESDSQPTVPRASGQFYWVWAPLNFDNSITLYHNNSDAEGVSWNTNAVICPTGDEPPQEMSACHSQITFASGSRHAKSATLNFEHRNNSVTTIELEAKWPFYMMGLGYGHPDWGHGRFRGEHEVGYDVIVRSEVSDCLPPHLHIQAFVTATLTGPDGKTHPGRGVLEQLIIGPHGPSGFTQLLDMAP